VSAPVEVSEDIVERIRTLYLALPEVTVRVDYSLTRARSTAQSFDIRRRSFCLLVAGRDPTGKPVPLLMLRADPDEREALLSEGHPFSASRVGRDRIGMLLTDNTDWEEIRELATESYRILAPKSSPRCSTSTRWPSSPLCSLTWVRALTATRTRDLLLRRTWAVRHRPDRTQGARRRRPGSQRCGAVERSPVSRPGLSQRIALQNLPDVPGRTTSSKCSG
jgi:hypothetical protein